jgi:hypothetical protein
VSIQSEKPPATEMNRLLFWYEKLDTLNIFRGTQHTHIATTIYDNHPQRICVAVRQQSTIVPRVLACAALWKRNQGNHPTKVEGTVAAAAASTASLETESRKSSNEGGGCRCCSCCFHCVVSSLPGVRGTTSIWLKKNPEAAVNCQHCPAHDCSICSC